MNENFSPNRSRGTPGVKSRALFPKTKDGSSLSPPVFVKHKGSSILFHSFSFLLSIIFYGFTCSMLLLCIVLISHVIYVTNHVIYVKNFFLGWSFLTCRRLRLSGSWTVLTHASLRAFSCGRGEYVTGYDLTCVCASSRNHLRWLAQGRESRSQPCLRNTGESKERTSDVVDAGLRKPHSIVFTVGYDTTTRPCASSTSHAA